MLENVAADPGLERGEFRVCSRSSKKEDWDRVRGLSVQRARCAHCDLGRSRRCGPPRKCRSRGWYEDVDRRTLTPVSSDSLICSRFFISTCWLISGLTRPLPPPPPPPLPPPLPLVPAAVVGAAAVAFAVPGTSSSYSGRCLPMWSHTRPNMSSPVGALKISKSFRVMGPLTSSTTCGQSGSETNVGEAVLIGS
jgi:hypothetical protein